MPPHTLPRAAVLAAASAVSAASLAAAASSPAAPLFALTPWGCNSVRYQLAAPGAAAIADTAFGPLAAAAPPCPGVPAPVASRDAAGARLAVGNLIVAVDAATGLLTATRADTGAVLLTQTGAAWGPPSPRARAGSGSVVVSFAGVNASEAVYGGGPLSWGSYPGPRVQLPFNKVVEDSEYYMHSGGQVSLVPLFYSSAGWALLWASPAYGNVTLSQAPAEASFHARATLAVDLWLSACPAGGCDMGAKPHPFGALITQFLLATGGTPKPLPLAAQGFIQSKDRYRNQTQVLAIAAEYKARNLPIDMIVIDYFRK